MEEKVFSWPQIVTSLNTLKITSLASSVDHSMALNSDGKIYSWGLSGNGQLGHSLSEDICPVPKFVTGLPSINKIYAASEHSMAIDSMKEF